MHPGLLEFRVADHLRHALPRQRLGDIALGDVLLDPWEDALEQLRRIAEQGCFRDPAGIKRVEDDAGLGVEAPVQFAADNNVAEAASCRRTPPNLP